MRLLVASEAHFLASPGGRIYACGSEDYPFWALYLGEFDQITVLARVRRIGHDPPSAPRADGPGVAFHALEDYQGPWEYLRSLGRLRLEVRRAAAAHEAFLLRAPGAIASLVWREIRKRRPCAVEVLGDPWEALAPGRISGIWRGPARRWSRSSLAQMCREAPVICYVTRSWLQRRYPPAPAAAGQMVFACPDVRLRPAAEPECARRLERIEQAFQGGRMWEAGFAGSLARLYKAPDVLLHAVRLCLNQGLPLRLSIAGDGRCRAALERLARKLGLGGRVQFLGALAPGAAMDAFLDRVDLFVLASHTEGMPRALLEAMSRGCPAIGSTAGGIPELLPPADLVEPGRADLLAGKILEVLRDPGRLLQMSRRNHAAARLYSPAFLDSVRRSFLRELRFRV
jgi:glycosyltransferase involved in cell wall biosynthesis